MSGEEEDRYGKELEAAKLQTTEPVIKPRQEYEEKLRDTMEATEEKWLKAVEEKKHLIMSDVDLFILRLELRGDDELKAVSVMGLSGHGKSFVRDWLVASGQGDKAVTVKTSDCGQGTDRPIVYMNPGETVRIKDCVGFSETNLSNSNAADADVLVVFMCPGAGSEEVHADVLVWAWRLRKWMRTVFVCPKLDELRGENKYKHLPMQEFITYVHDSMAKELYRQFEEMRKRPSLAHLEEEGRLAPEVEVVLWDMDEAQLCGWLKEWGALFCWCDAKHLAGLSEEDRPAADADRQRLLSLVSADPQHRAEYAYSDGSKYKGERKEGRPHGQGECTWANGSKYRGEWKNDKPHGQGEHTWADGAKYKGEWEEGKWHGLGEHTWADDAKYKGEWKEGKQHGQGEYTWANGDKYKGEWKDDKRHGLGEHTYVDGNKYNGEWKEDKQHGQGEYAWATGEKYKGEWKEDKKHGRGEHTWPGGDKYIGEYKEGKKHGQGERTKTDGEKYKGEWKEGKRHGLGEQTWANGDKYRGEWKEDKAHGLGEATWANGKKYKGEWKEHKHHGLGECTWADGEKYKGEWKENKKDGLGFVVSSGDARVHHVQWWQNGEGVRLSLVPKAHA